VCVCVCVCLCVSVVCVSLCVCVCVGRDEGVTLVPGRALAQMYIAYHFCVSWLYISSLWSLKLLGALKMEK